MPDASLLRGWTVRYGVHPTGKRYRLLASAKRAAKKASAKGPAWVIDAKTGKSPAHYAEGKPSSMLRKNPGRTIRVKNFSGTIKANPNGTVTVKGKAIGLKRKRNESISEGFWRGGTFHPIRSADDYDPSAVGEDRTYSTRKRKAIKKKTAPKRKATARRKR